LVLYDYLVQTSELFQIIPAYLYNMQNGTLNFSYEACLLERHSVE